MATMLVATFIWNSGLAMWTTVQTFPEFSQPLVIKVSYFTDFHLKEQPSYYGLVALSGLLGIAHMVYKLR